MAPPITIPDPSTLGMVAHNNQGYIVIVTVIVCFLIATPATVGRIYTRKFIIGQLWIDDYLTMLAWTLMFALGITECVQVRYGAGAHIWDLPQPDGILLFQANWAGVLLYNLCLCATKSMFFFQYYRVVKDITKLKIIYSLVGVLVMAWSIGQVILILVNCVPIAGNWDPNIDAKCMTLPETYGIWMTSAGNLATDVIILILPIPVVWNLNLKKKPKLILRGVFCLGFFTCLISSLRMFALKKTADMTYDAASLLCWSIAEVASGVTCACIPTLRPLASKYLSSAFGSSGSGNRQSSRGYENYGSSENRKRRRESRGVFVSDNTLVEGDDQNFELGAGKSVPVHVRQKSDVESPTK
ncbi:hypothetical protein PFICI_13836 [Pestalotiopsis fici W106-1]|uniref:Rhodopsin domain-containing protein n=1 Tax=Pestalotiopsis fici (strain W106-1 / CGMCC3.15140) TaxID=1229662 RepID=W3WJ65_PESFW|nr:uncharacterized protein PFICI_13836 [Pestalotiopsis fici W106-1]ETS73970.1 hypothetical protein PFICI_13836 [Pestalotiopsis fici W106-1]